MLKTGTSGCCNVFAAILSLFHAYSQCANVAILKFCMFRQSKNLLMPHKTKPLFFVIMNLFQNPLLSKSRKQIEIENKFRTTYFLLFRHTTHLLYAKGGYQRLRDVLAAIPSLSHAK